mgnify:CR=1 FL=1
MSRDRSLDEFAGTVAAEDDEGGASDDDADGEISADVDEEISADADEEISADADEVLPADGDGVEPASSTYRWEPEGSDCAECGQATTRLWAQDDAHVCADCKEW